MRRKNEHHYRTIIDFIDVYYNQHNRSPSTREIAQSINLSRSTVQRYLKSLNENGIIEYNGHRNIVTEYIQTTQSVNFSRVPLAGRIPCGNLNEVSIAEPKCFLLPKALIGQGEFFLLTASGNSMIEAGISDGDLVLIKRQRTAVSNQIVAVLYESDQTTLKRICFEKNHIVLHPDNSEMQDIVIEGKDQHKLYIQGIAIKVIKDLK